MKKINEDMTRREMKQVKIYIDPDIAEAYKLLCKDKGSSINAELEKYIIDQVKHPEENMQHNTSTELSYKEAMESIKEELYNGSKFK